MKTKLRKAGDMVVVDVEGRLSFEDDLPLKEALSQIQDTGEEKKIIFNLEHLDFVGSSGISSFIRTLADIHTRQSVKPRLCNVKTEFQRIMKALDESRIFEFYENEDRAKRSFDN